MRYYSNDPAGVDERAADARSLLGNRAFDEALDELNQHYVSMLLSEQVGSSAAATAHASMKVLADVVAKLKQYTNPRTNTDRRLGNGRTG